MNKKIIPLVVNRAWCDLRSKLVNLDFQVQPVELCVLPIELGKSSLMFKFNRSNL